MKLIFTNFWFILIIIGLINYFIMKFRILKNFKERVDIEEGNRFLILTLIFVNVPFLIMGILQRSGGFNNFLFIFSGQYQNTYVLLAWLSIIVIWGLILYWVLFKDGAKMISKYRVIFRNMPEDETKIKFLTVLMVLGGVVALIVGNIAIP